MQTNKWTYYNDSDPKCCAWIKELINARLISDGEIDNRSITNVKFHEIRNFRRVHFFAGIAGWEYALRLAGWPEDKPVWTASCPCQPFSGAGKNEGLCDERHLWPAFRNIVADGNPSIIFGEQVASKDGRAWLAGIRSDLEGMGFAFGGADLCAASIGAPHRRQRLYWVANSKNPNRRTGIGSEKTGIRKEGIRRIGLGSNGDALTVADNQRKGLERHARDANQRRQSRRKHTQEAGSASENRATGTVADAEHNGSCESKIAEAVTNGNRSDGRLHYRSSSHWERYDIITCRDGKTRRFEPESFPLDYGFSGRVELLRGYGNAIVPPLAAEFIQAAKEAIGI